MRLAGSVAKITAAKLPGRGVGVEVGVGIGLGVGVAVAVAVGVGLGGIVAVAVALGSTVAVGVGGGVALTRGAMEIQPIIISSGFAPRLERLKVCVPVALTVLY